MLHAIFLAVNNFSCQLSCYVCLVQSSPVQFSPVQLSSVQSSPESLVHLPPFSGLSYYSPLISLFY